jgi:hypothetical protein
MEILQKRVMNLIEDKVKQTPLHICGSVALGAAPPSGTCAQSGLCAGIKPVGPCPFRMVLCREQTGKLPDRRVDKQKLRDALPSAFWYQPSKSLADLER